MTHKTIQFYTREVYGSPMGYVADKNDAAIIARLTGRKTIDCVTRELIADLTGGAVRFQEILQSSVPPRK